MFVNMWRKSSHTGSISYCNQENPNLNPSPYFRCTVLQNLYPSPQHAIFPPEGFVQMCPCRSMNTHTRQNSDIVQSQQDSILNAEWSLLWCFVKADTCLNTCSNTYFKQVTTLREAGQQMQKTILKYSHSHSWQLFICRVQTRFYKDISVNENAPSTLHNKDYFKSRSNYNFKIIAF